MPIVVKCTCGKAFKAPDKLAGKAVKCPGCSQPVTVGEASVGGRITPAKKTSDSINVSCSLCGHQFQAPQKLVGKKVKCPSCSSPTLVERSNRTNKQAQGKPIPQSQVSKTKKKESTSGQGDGCPQCEKPINSGDVICTHCGFNLKTGKAVGRTTTDEAEASNAEITVFVVIAIAVLSGIAYFIYTLVA